MPYAKPNTDPAVHLDIHIDELVLSGFDRLNRVELGAEVERALGQLFVERGAPSSLSEGGQLDRLDGGAFTVPAGSDLRSVAEQIAQSIYRGFES